MLPSGFPMKRLLLSALLLIFSGSAVQAVETYTVISGRTEYKQQPKDSRGMVFSLIQSDDSGVKDTLLRFFTDLGTYDPSAIANGHQIAQILRVQTTAIGSPDQFAPYNDARDKRQEQVNTALGIGVFIATLGRVDIGGGGRASDHNITADSLEKLPPGAKKIIVTRVDSGFSSKRNPKGEFAPTLSKEIFTAAYEDISDEELRVINLREGVMRTVGMINVFKAWEAGEIKKPELAKTVDAAQ